MAASTVSNVKEYNDDSIQHVSSLEHIRLRPGMYIGRLGDGTHQDDGIYVLMKEVIDNSIDEFIMGCGNRITVRREGDLVSVRDYGRGIPLGKVVECVSQINTGAKYNNSVFQFSVGLNGVGTKAVNAMSSSFHVKSFRGGEFVEAFFEKGQLVKENKGRTDEGDGTLTEFVADREVFGKYAYDDDFIIKRIENYCYLNTGLTIDYNKRIFKSQHGLLDLLEKEVEDNGIYNMLHYKSKTLEFAFTHTREFSGETYYSYVNGQYTSDGGTHQAAFKEGLLKGINEFFKKSWSPQDVREGIVGAISIKVETPVFESQTKNKLGNTEIRGPIIDEVKEAVVEFLHKNPEDAQKLSQKIIQNETIRKKLSEVKKVAKENAKKISLNIPKLKDCKFHLGQSGAHADMGERSMIFLTEGDSASGTLNTARDVMTQAVFSLRGKPLNTNGLSMSDMYKNVELYNVMAALGIENGIEGLRYGKVIFATDADIDGFHIRILLLTYFLSYFEELIRTGRVWILDTPLFRVRNKSVTTYCYSEEERDAMMKQIKGSEVTRFKGLGEISAKEFGQFIGEDMRLIPVTIESLSDARKAMNFYMGNNTPERRDFIMDNLV
ncbi:MAG: type IIA DNA topoisomerase subunit B [Sphaerochaetaceae bacterium]|nr:type IIA DNA topoisomerase subunit B [Sphaerochaetaceae bacterium]